MVDAFGGALAGQLVVLAQEGRQPKGASRARKRCRRIAVGVYRKTTKSKSGMTGSAQPWRSPLRTPICSIQEHLAHKPETIGDLACDTGSRSSHDMNAAGLQRVHSSSSGRPHALERQGERLLRSIRAASLFSNLHSVEPVDLKLHSLDVDQESPSRPLQIASPVRTQPLVRMAVFRN